jgi:hypothetical protein
MTIYPLYKYESNLFVTSAADPIIGLIRLNPAASVMSVESATNIEPDGAANTTEPIRATRTKFYGITARHIVISRIVDGQRVYRKIPILTPDFFIDILSTAAPSITYEGASNWILVGGMGERYRLHYAASS